MELKCNTLATNCTAQTTHAHNNARNTHLALFARGCFVAVTSSPESPGVFAPLPFIWPLVLGWVPDASISSSTSGGGVPALLAHPSVASCITWSPFSPMTAQAHSCYYTSVQAGAHCLFCMPKSWSPTHAPWHAQFIFCWKQNDEKWEISTNTQPLQFFAENKKDTSQMLWPKAQMQNTVFLSSEKIQKWKTNLQPHNSHDLHPLESITQTML